MITVVLVENPLRPSERIVAHPCAMPLRQWIGEQWPGGVKGSLVVSVNGKRLDDEAVQRVELVDGDHVLAIVVPAWALIAEYAVHALIAMAISLAMSVIFRPKKPTALVDQPSESPVYSISGSQNAARLGEPIPVGYGTFIQTPDFASQPYTYFENNEMFLAEILVLGQGEYDVDEMFVGQSTIDNVPHEVWFWAKYGPAQHFAREGNIEDATGIFENCVTSPEVGDQELLPETTAIVAPSIHWHAYSSYSYVPPDGVPPSTGTEQTLAWLQAHGEEALGSAYWYKTVATVDAETTIIWWTFTYVVAVAYGSVPPATGSVYPTAGTDIVDGPWIGWFNATKPGQQVDLAMLDFVFGAGLYATDLGSGAYLSTSVEVTAEFQPIDADGNFVGSPVSQSWTFTGAAGTPQRYTVSKVLSAARYAIRAHRSSAGATEATTQDRCTWFGLKTRVVRKPTSHVVYGDTTLAAVRLRASNGIASAATSRIRFRVTRKLAPLGSGTPERTSNPADAFVDVMTSTTYGAARPLSEVDLPALETVRAAWAAAAAANEHNGFNAVFAQRSTVFEALNMTVQVVAASPLPIGQLMSVQVDTVKDSRVAMFTEANLSNLVVGYEFDKVGTPEGVRVEYRDPDSFSPAFALVPEDAVDYDSVSLFGCTDADVAQQYAQLVDNRRRLLRKTITFDTELEGLILLPGDRFAVQHSMPRWGQVGIVDEIEADIVIVPPDTSQTLLLHADGTDASTTVTDSSLNAATMTPAGNAQIDTAQSVFGGASLLFDGTGDYVDTPVHARYDIGAISSASNHTWRFRARFAAAAPSSPATAILAALKAWWPLDENAATPTYSDVHGTNHLTQRNAAGNVNTSVNTTTTAVQGRAWFPNHTDNLTLYIPRSNTALDAVDADFSFGGWFRMNIDAATAAFLIGRVGGTTVKVDAYLGVEGTDNKIKFWVSHTDGSIANRVTADSGQVYSSSTYVLVVGTYDKTAGNIIIRTRLVGFAGSKTTQSMGGHAVYTGSNNSNFCINEGLDANANFFGSNRAAATLADECFYCMKAFTDADFDYLYNAGAGKTYAALVADASAPGTPPREVLIAHARPNVASGSGGGGYALVMDAGKLGIEVGPSTSFAHWRTAAAVVVDSHWYALAFVIEAGVPHIYVDGTEASAAFAAGSTLIGIDTTRTDYPLRIGASATGADGVAGHIDELSVMIGTAAYTANYTPESAAFPAPDPGGSFEDTPTLTLDRGLDWDAVDEPFAVLLSSEVNGVSAHVLCARGDADHKVVLLEAAPFDLFGKGEHQEQTRVAFGTLDNIVRDWICVSAAPSSQTQIKVDGLIYNPDVYDGAMPHQGGEALPPPIPPGVWMIAGDPLALSVDVAIGGTPAAPSSPDDVLAGDPDNPSTWLEPEGPP